MEAHEGAVETAGASSWRAWARVGGAVAVLLVLGMVVARLILIPSHGVRSVAACRRAYAVARTHADTVLADMLSYPDSAAVGHRRPCGALRTARVDLTRR